MSLQGGGVFHTILAFTLVIHVDILPIWAVSLFIKPGMKSTFVAPCTRVWHRAWFVRRLEGTIDGRHWLNQH